MSAPGWTKSEPGSPRHTMPAGVAATAAVANRWRFTMSLQSASDLPIMPGDRWSATASRRRPAASRRPRRSPIWLRNYTTQGLRAGRWQPPGEIAGPSSWAADMSLPAPPSTLGCSRRWSKHVGTPWTGGRPFAAASVPQRACLERTNDGWARVCRLAWAIVGTCRPKRAAKPGPARTVRGFRHLLLTREQFRRSAAFGARSGAHRVTPAVCEDEWQERPDEFPPGGQMTELGPRRRGPGRTGSRNRAA